MTLLGYGYGELPALWQRAHCAARAAPLSSTPSNGSRVSMLPSDNIT